MPSALQIWLFQLIDKAHIMQWLFLQDWVFCPTFTTVGALRRASVLRRSLSALAYPQGDAVVILGFFPSGSE